MDLLAAVPVKPFGVAKARLAGVVDGPGRQRLGTAIAAHTIAAACTAATVVGVVTADDGVAAWAAGLGAEVIRDPGAGLDAAAAAAVAAAADRDMAWAIVHADLPLVTKDDLAAVVAALEAADAVIAPSYDGGTNVLAGRGAAPDFGYGAQSFHRHLRHMAHRRPRVLCRPGLALDLDTPADLVRVLAHPGGAWIGDYLGDPA